MTMCTTIVIVALIVGAVLIFPALARAISATVLILIAFVALACAEERRPMPQPQVGSGCPSGYASSPTSRTCAPIATTRCKAFLSPTGSYLTGWTYSPTSRMCVEVGC
jgi:hypothetical protein